MKARNVLFIIADQFRADCLGLVNPLVRTPNLDMLAREGVRFDNCFCQTAPCGPSRASLFMSRYLCGTRSVDNNTPLRDAHENAGQVLRERGYAPAVIGYHDYTPDPSTLPEGDPRKAKPHMRHFLPGWDVLLDQEYISAAWFEHLRAKGVPEPLLSFPEVFMPNAPEDLGGHIKQRYPAHYRAEDSDTQFEAAKAIEHMGSGARPWVLNLDFIKPHPPWVCPEPYHEMYDPAKMPLANRTQIELNSMHPYIRAALAEPKLADDQARRELWACYLGMITELDASLGRLFGHLRDTGQWDNTLIIFTSDHGEYMGDHWSIEKPHFWDEALHVPLIIRDPSEAAGPARGKVLADFVELIDLMPTVFEWLGETPPACWQGRSVLGRMRGIGGGPHRTEVHFERDYRNHLPPEHIPDRDAALLWVIRDARYKYVQFAESTMPALLYDLVEDPGEQHDLASDPAYAKTCLDYAQRLLQWRMKHEDQRMEHLMNPHRRWKKKKEWI